jgi:hypothetical protein
LRIAVVSHRPTPGTLYPDPRTISFSNPPFETVCARATDNGSRREATKHAAFNRFFMNSIPKTESNYTTLAQIFKSIIEKNLSSIEKLSFLFNQIPYLFYD